MHVYIHWQSICAVSTGQSAQRPLVFLELPCQAPTTQFTAAAFVAASDDGNSFLVSPIQWLEESWKEPWRFSSRIPKNTSSCFLGSDMFPDLMRNV